MPISWRAASTGCSTTRSTCSYLDGFDLRGARLAERKRLLAELLADASERILFAEHLEEEGAQIRERAGAMGVIVETPASPPNL
jgi:ATP-dependent DNA ligase